MTSDQINKFSFTGKTEDHCTRHYKRNSLKEADMFQRVLCGNELFQHLLRVDNIYWLNGVKVFFWQVLTLMPKATVLQYKFCKETILFQPGDIIPPI